MDLSKLKEAVHKVQNKQMNYNEMADEILGEENRWSSDNWRKFFYIIQPILERIEIESISSDEILQQLEEAKLELAKERIRVQDQRRELKKLYSPQARFERLVEVLEENISPFELEINTTKRISQASVEATLVVSDAHIGIEIENEVNKFNVEIAKNRFAQLAEETIRYCKLHKVEKLRIILNGDLLSGVIQLGCRLEQEEDVISQILLASEMISNLVKSICEQDIYVEIYGATGNHSRVLADKKQSLDSENFERLVFEYIKLKLPKVKLITGKNVDYVEFDIKGKKAIATHGHRDTLANATNHFVSLLGYKADYIFLGHIHHLNVKNDNNTKIIVNGSINGADAYALSLRCSTKPSQVLVIHERNDLIIEIELD